MLDVRRMRVLQAVATHGSIASAADALGYTPSAISQHIARLEQETSVALVERTANSMRLTQAGYALVKRTEVIVGELLAAEAELKALGGLEPAGVRIGAFATAAATLVAVAMRRFAARRPDVVLTLVEGDPEDTVPRLRSGQLDLALTYEYDHLPLVLDASLERHLLLSEPMRLVLPVGHASADRDFLELAELAGERWISEPRADCRDFSVRACAAAGFQAQVSCLCSDYHTTQALVAAGAGVALIPDLALTAPPAGTVVRELHHAPRRRIFGVHRRSDSHRPLLRRILEDLTEEAAVRDAGAAARDRAPRRGFALQHRRH